MDAPLKYTDLATKAGISPSYACELLAGTRTPSRSMAFQIWRNAGMKFGPIAHLSDQEVEQAAQFEPKAA